MKKIPGILGNTLGIVLLIGMIVVLIFFLNGIKQGKNGLVTFDSPVSTPLPETEPTPIPLQGEIPAETVLESPLLPTATPTPIVVEPEPTATPTSVTEHPPLCKFVGAKEETMESESLLDQYAFSEPKIVLSHNGAIEISQWLPDNQRVLISRGISEKSIWLIETVNVETGLITKYAEGTLLGFTYPSESIVWLDAQQAVAYTEPDEKTKQRVLQIGYEGKTAETAYTNLASPYIATASTKSWVVFETTEDLVHPLKYDLETEKAETLGPKNSIEVPIVTDYMDTSNQYQITLRPDGNQYTYYNNEAFYLVDVENGNTCEVNLGTAGDYGKRWALFAEWSPNSRYLALLTTAGDFPVPFIDLSILDTVTSKYYSIDIKGSGDVYIFTWAPNSRDILAVAQNPTNDNGHNVYVVDSITGNSKQILSDNKFLFSGNTGVAWSSDGGKIVLDCFEQKQSNEIHLCLINVGIQ